MILPLASWTYGLEESEIRRLLRVRTRYYMAGGIPGKLPLGAFSAIFREMASELSSDFGDSPMLNYGATEGIAEFREVLADRLRRTEKVSGEIAISSGSQQSIYAVLKIIADEGDVIIAPEPTYLGFLGPCQILGLRVITVPMSERGLEVEDLTNAYLNSLQEYRRRPVAIYFPSFADNPTGHSPSWRNKLEVYDFAVSHDLIVLEDNAYKEIYFGGSKHIPMKSLDKENETVVYMSTTSKEAAVLRVGYSVMPDYIMDPFVKLKGFLDLCTSSLDQQLALRYYRDHIDSILPQVRELYKRQRDAMVRSFDENIGGVRSAPQGGFFVWADLGDVNSKQILPSVIECCDLSYVPGSAFLSRGEATGWVRLSYSSLDPESIWSGMELLGKFLRN